MCTNPFQNGVLSFCIHLMEGMTYVAFSPLLLFRVDVLLEIAKWILKPELLTDLHMQLVYIYAMCTSISGFKYVNSIHPFKP